MTASDKDLDAMIAEALDAEDRELLDQFGPEPGYFAQALGLFGGRLGWVMWVTYITNIASAGLAIWAAWNLVGATDTLAAIRWGVATLAAMQVGLFMKGFLGQQMQNNRVIREVKRLELQLVRSQARHAV
ncbi:DUF6768 family protein [Maricaulis salignorans]|uniref:DUF6768 family protein n=1 Tax=Maricaulis salignorans TaxID=144026 RepID=UPI003A90B0E8